MVALELGRGASFAHEPALCLLVCAHLGLHQLDGPELIQIDVTRSYHRAHAANTEHALHAVLAREDLAYLSRRCGLWLLLCHV